MKVKEGTVDELIYNICSVIHGICKLNLEFIDIDDTSASFQLVNSKIPDVLSDSISRTLKYIDCSLQNNIGNDIMHFTDNLQLSYLAVGFFEKSKFKGSVILGPFLSAVPDDAFVSKVLEKNNLPLVHRLQLREYYKSIPIYDFNDIKNVGLLMINLASNTFISKDIIYVSNESAIINEKESESINEGNLISDIELRYKVEKEILNAVEKGSKAEALEFKKLFRFKATHRAPNDPLRAYKNLTFSFNTLLRIACERGGVSPIYISPLSDKFATLIENISTIRQLDTLGDAMVAEYCDLVTKYSTAGYSSIIKKAINYINLNYQDPISLNSVASSIDINPSHLSRQFKKETEMTITDFINTKRVKEAKYLIEQNNNSITDIALMVGFDNHTYFCKVFKKLTSLTPKEYLKKSSLNNK
ncbi:helix-turn-helix domain-containing protein [Clostridium folliculivorans]|uniref:AraC family transcriptional regulator n=1 Tax=Clostridium folliculivorans TaxID=2886038 RepID=A0A9W6DC40_9CLOT|nr:helix-turn-helix domain-containing protein [Clostridium folliculivorans]GKU26596.1 AraC family transcriptional regulator [Clostridium folliculivorans]GKU28972.1 AraC family transcriptional regulator [Clostridium folliculivorans]